MDTNTFTTTFFKFFEVLGIFYNRKFVAYCFAVILQISFTVIMRC